ncbi:MAG TPA: PDDEXK nuclease domain-containing protein [Prosthecobacter sp.]|nr:PDDEXK nuclease domain-containing protein [Prosthecobacter sp.]
MSDLPLNPEQQTFTQIAHLIQASRTRAFQAVNQELIDLYWEVGRIISEQVRLADWGKRVIDDLAKYLRHSQPGLRGFARPNLYRMKQFYEAYPGREFVSAVPRQLSWTHNILILEQSKTPEEREFYLRMAIRERWSSRELERQFRLARFEQAVLNPPKVQALNTQLQSAASAHFKDSYVLEFLNLPDGHNEQDLHRSLLANLRKFLTELGRDFCFIGSEHPIQVGKQDFALDLLFFHRELNCLVAIELKVGRFEPEYLGKLNFYLEALDRDIRKPHENPSIGLLLCASKDDEVVQYSLSRSLSPALIADYKTKLPDKALLQAKLHEFLALAQIQSKDDPSPAAP